MGANGNEGADRAGHVGSDEDGNRDGIGHWQGWVLMEMEVMIEQAMEGGGDSN